MVHTEQGATSAPSTSQDILKLEDKYGARVSQPVPVVANKGEGVFVWDIEGKKYYDFFSAFWAVNQGHCHPRLVKLMAEQAQKLTLTSRAFHNDQLGPYCQFITKLFGYDRVLPMNTGVEAGETAVKLTRKWAYLVKGIAENKARIIFAKNNFWGRSLAACSSSTDPSCYSHYGPFTPGFEIVPYNDLPALKKLIDEDTENTLAGFYIEPIQGEAGVVVPSEDYLPEAFRMCKEHNMLFIADEIQTGLARTGKMLCVEHSNVKPDVVCLGKALSGGMMPVSAVLANDEVMLCIKPGEHGSTYGGNPLACVIAKEALKIIVEERLAENAEKMGCMFRSALMKLKEECEFIQCVRGKGLLNAVVIDPEFKVSAWDICMRLAEEGILCKPTHEHIIRFAPPLTISASQMDDALVKIKKVFKDCLREGEGCGRGGGQRCRVAARERFARHPE